MFEIYIPRFKDSIYSNQTISFVLRTSWFVLVVILAVLCKWTKALLRSSKTCEFRKEPDWKYTIPHSLPGCQRKSSRIKTWSGNLGWYMVPRAFPFLDQPVLCSCIVCSNLLPLGFAYFLCVCLCPPCVSALHPEVCHMFRLTCASSPPPPPPRVKAVASLSSWAKSSHVLHSLMLRFLFTSGVAFNVYIPVLSVFHLCCFRLSHFWKKKLCLIVICTCSVFKLFLYQL